MAATQLMYHADRNVTERPQPVPRKRFSCDLAYFNSAAIPVPKPRTKTISAKESVSAGVPNPDVHTADEDQDLDLSKIELEDVNAMEKSLLSSLKSGGIKQTDIPIGIANENNQIVAYETWQQLIDIFIHQIKQDRANFREKATRKITKWKERAIKIRTKKMDLSTQLNKVYMERREEKVKFEKEFQSRVLQYEKEIDSLKHRLEHVENDAKQEKDKELESMRQTLEQYAARIAELEKVVNDCAAENSDLRTETSDLKETLGKDIVPF